VLDVDRLKPINDAFGHAAGDQVLKAIVAALLRQIRSSDVIGAARRR
jgi:diguanylate cyclase (GGDEF)-like protein